ncbi:hypothetical protein F4860DRAFT_35055 [Xylaria cubensis]|nr:hypothetical protein F4860DRAFT_35055 [Xylaria cubensis]
MLDGAYGARAMHALQNYGMKQTIYDGNAYTFSATFITKFLQLYAHHVVAPTTPGGAPRYCMTSIDGYWLGKNENYSEAVRALRNLRVIAQEARDRFIKVANTRARGNSPEQTDEDDFHDCSAGESEEEEKDDRKTVPTMLRRGVGGCQGRR